MGKSAKGPTSGCAQRIDARSEHRSDRIVTGPRLTVRGADRYRIERTKRRQLDGDQLHRQGHAVGPGQHRRDHVG
jgi:hypothetical protein